MTSPRSPSFVVLGLSVYSWHLWNCGLGVTTSCFLDNLLFSQGTRAPTLPSFSGFHHLLSVQMLGFLAHCLHSPGSLCPLHLWGQLYEAPPSTPCSHVPMASLQEGKEPCPTAGDRAPEIQFPWPLPPGCYPSPPAPPHLLDVTITASNASTSLSGVTLYTLS